MAIEQEPTELSKIYEEIGKDLSSGKLSPDEISKLKELLDDIIETELEKLYDDHTSY